MAQQQTATRGHSIAQMLSEAERAISSIRAQLGLGGQATTTTTTTVAKGDGAIMPVPRTTRARRRSRKPVTEMTSWMLTKRARRLPTFVIEATGLKTVKELR